MGVVNTGFFVLDVTVVGGLGVRAIKGGFKAGQAGLGSLKRALAKGGARAIPEAAQQLVERGFALLGDDFDGRRGSNRSLRRRG